MSLKLLLIVVVTSIIAFFSDEFTRLFKKLFLIPGMKLVLPLVIASCLIVLTEEWGQWLLTGCERILESLIHLLTSPFPFETVIAPLLRIIYLFMIASLPILIFRFSDKQKNIYEPQPYLFWLGLSLWLVAAILLTVYNESHA